MRLFGAGVACLVLFSVSSAAADVIVNLASQSSLPTPVTLEPGIYDLVPIGPADGGSFAAWNPWGAVDGCDPSGMCDAGYLHLYYSTGAVVRSYSSPGRYASAQLALDHAQTFSIALATGGTVNFYISDSVYSDNLGGVSIRVVQRTTGVPDVGPPVGPTLAVPRNPFPVGSEIRFSLPAPADIRLDLVDIAGRRVAQLTNGPRSAGEHRVRWNGTEDDGDRAAAGLYFVRLDTGSRRVTTRIVLIP